MRWLGYSGKLAIFLVLFGGATVKSDEHEQPPPDEGRPSTTAKGDTSSIPLASILTTSPQQGMLHPREVFHEQSKDRKNVVTNGYLRQILQGTKGGASNIFLVDATNVNDAVNASFSVLVGARGADTPAPVNKPDPVRGSHWLVAYLGTGPSSPTWWVVESVVVDGSTVRLTYRKTRPTAATRDAHQYYYWVPLPTLDPGSYELKLYTSDRNLVTLMRRVEMESTR